MDRSLNGDDFRLLARWQNEDHDRRVGADRPEPCVEAHVPAEPPLDFRRSAVVDARGQRTALAAR